VSKQGVQKQFAVNLFTLFPAKQKREGRPAKRRRGE